MKITELPKYEEIWIAGSDPSLDTYPNDFIDDKLMITLHLAYVKFPGADYHYFNEMDRWTYLKENYPEIKKKTMIFGYPFYNRTVEQADEVIGDVKCYKLDLRPYPPQGNVQDIYTDVGKMAMADLVDEAVLGKRTEFGGSGTCLHPCMYTALTMGAKTINIIGCGFEAQDDKEHFGKLHEVDAKMRPQTGSFTGARGERMTLGLNAILEGCKRNKITVNRFKDYEQASHLYPCI